MHRSSGKERERHEACDSFFFFRLSSLSYYLVLYMYLLQHEMDSYDVLRTRYNVCIYYIYIYKVHSRTLV